MQKQIRILIVDDQPRARQSLRALLATFAGIEEIQEAKNGLEALQRIDDFSPDIVFMDVRMPGLDGISTTQLIKQHAPRIKIIVLSMYPDNEQGAVASGADAFVCKCDPPEQLLKALAKQIAESPQGNGGKD
jgi:two-component system, NarL family, invasion response regulator UvrY